MSRLLTGGFELQSLGGEGFDTSSGGIAGFDTSIFRSGSTSAKLNSGSGNYITNKWYNGGVLNRTYFARIWVRLGGNPTGSFTIAGFVDNANNMTNAKTVMNSSRQITGADGTLSSALATGVFHCIEISGNWNGTNVVWTVRLNGVVVGAQATTADTKTPAGFRFGNTDLFNNNNPQINMDDYAVNDDQGSAQNSWCGTAGKTALLQPVADHAIGSEWLLGNGAAPAGAAFDAVNNKPPTGVATGSATSTSQITHSTTTVTEPAADADLELTDYTTAGVGASDVITAISLAADTSTNNTTTVTGLSMVSNPAIAETTGQTSGSPGGFPSGWKHFHVGTSSSPTGITKSTRPVARVRKGNAPGGALLTCCNVYAYVEYEPVSAPTPPTTGQLHPRGWKNTFAPASGQLLPRQVIT